MLYVPIRLVKCAKHIDFLALVVNYTVFTKFSCCYLFIFNANDIWTNTQVKLYKQSHLDNVMNRILLACRPSGICPICGPGSSVSIATVYGLDVPGIQSRYGRDFPQLSRPALGPTQSPVQWVLCLSRGKEHRGVTLTPHPFYCRGQERVELFLYSPYWPYRLYRASVPVQGYTLHCT
jgi:hypothetical protein